MLKAPPATTELGVLLIPALKVESDDEVRQRDLDVSSFGFPFFDILA